MENFTQINWPETVKDIADKRQMSIRQLASDLGCSQQFLSEVAAGKKPPGVGLRLKILGAIRFQGPRSQLLELLFTSEEASLIVQWEQAMQSREALP